MEETKLIGSIEEANRYAYAIKKTKKEVESIRSQAQKEIEIWQQEIQGLKEWEENQLKPLLDKIDYFETLLTDFHRRAFLNAETEKEQNKLKSMKLPYGVTLKSFLPQSKYVVQDEDAYVDYARQKGFIRLKEEVNWKEMKDKLVVMENGKVIDADGEVINFISVEEQARKFELKLSDNE